MMGHLTGNLRAASGSGSGSLSAGASGGAGASAPSPFAAPEVQAPAAVAQTLAACGARPGAALPASLEPYAAGPGLGLGLGSGRGLQLGGRLLDESSSVPQLVGLPPPLAPQPDAQLLPAQPEASSLPGGAFNPSRATPVDGNASLVSSTDRFGGDGGSSACELDGGARFASVTGGAAAALEANLARSHAMALAQQQCAQVAPSCLLQRAWLWQALLRSHDVGVLHTWAFSKYYNSARDILRKLLGAGSVWGLAISLSRVVSMWCHCLGHGQH